MQDSAATTANSDSARDRAALIHPMTDLQRHDREGPLLVTRGEGVHVYDDDGNAYIEGVSGLWSVSLGFGQTRLADAAYRQMRELPSYHLFRHKSHPPAIRLAERLLAIAPVPMSKVFFANSGSEANDTAVKLAWYYNNALGRPGKKKIIGRIGGYHGITVASGSITGLARNHADFDLPLPNFLHTDCPSHWKYGLPGESEAAYAVRLAANLEALILREGPETIAAFFAEPVIGSGGVIVPPAGYFDLIQPILRKYDILFIADEVICGFGRLGAMFGGSLYGLAPDMITVAKGLSSGYLPISALMMSEAIWEACYAQSGKLGVFGHGFTYSGHPVAAAVALETLDLYKELDVLGNVARLAPLLQQGIRSHAEHPLVGEARGVGFLGGWELVADKTAKTPFAEPGRVGLMVERHCQARGVILRALGDILSTAPPLIATAPDIERIVEVVGEALDATLDDLARGVRI
ncbi:aminotransferase [Methylobrevis albus]|uniref:Aminotransferase class III-fold pyridoxal phosphate-dependent enzyme n=1 Tax=Methylobrevis albus TaxID=2793297 RepID=A0A931N0T2_9HYPH|nr:aminotransferase [Methylobrevis albus]MBH0239096.1 aminotransferase class III-fold pyridoxal phosphate-dependent enzyme [Methylobrevis albus]